MSAREQLAEVIRDGEGTWRTPMEAADAILAAGYGKLADAWDEGRRVGHAHPYTQFTARPCPSNPYRSES